VSALRNGEEAPIPVVHRPKVERASPTPSRPLPRDSDATRQPTQLRAIIGLRMMLLFGRGHIRAEAELNKLFGALGLKASRALSLPPSPNIIVEGRIE
jgi:hypothetical protein